MVRTSNENRLAHLALSVEVLQRLVAQMFAVSVEELNGEGKTQAVVVPRQIAMYLVNRVADASVPEIAEHFGRKHPSTVMRAIAKIGSQRCADGALDRVITRILGIVRAP